MSADVVLTVPQREFEELGGGFSENPRAGQKWVLPKEELYAGFSKLLVKTALIRVAGYDRIERPFVRAPYDAARICRHVADYDQEHVVTLACDNGSRLLAIHEAAIGVTSSTVTTGQHILKVAILVSAPVLLVVHNHPSEETDPSPDDVQMTRQLVEATRLMGVTLLDHIIVARRRWTSIQEGATFDWDDNLVERLPRGLTSMSGLG